MTQLQELQTSEQPASPDREPKAIVVGSVRFLTSTASVLLFVTTLFALAARHHWLADVCANLRMQWIVGLAVLAFFSTLQRRWSLLRAQVAALALNASFVGYAVLGVSMADGPVVIRVTTANVLVQNQQFEAITIQLQQNDPDVVAVLELSVGLERHLADRFEKNYPYARKLPGGEGSFGLGLYSKVPFESIEVLTFNDERIASMAAIVQVRGRPFRILATHTLPPMGERAFHHRNSHLAALAELVQEWRQAEPDVPVIVAGDLNITPWSPVFHQFREDAGLSRMPHGLTPTWYRLPTFAFGLVLDHVLTTNDLQCQYYRVSPDVGSDHRFVTARFANR